MENILKILAVDDDLINLKLLNSMLKTNGYVKEVLDAQNGLEALNLLEEHPDTHMILLDIKMPIMNGLEFLANIQTMPKLKHIPIVVLTTDETKRHEVFEKGAYDFLVKPIRREKLFEKIAKIAKLVR